MAHPEWTRSGLQALNQEFENPSAPGLMCLLRSATVSSTKHIIPGRISPVSAMGLIVTDGRDFFCEEKRDTDHSIKWVKPGIPAYQITNSSPDNKFDITKQIIADPFRNTILQKIVFNSKQSDTPYQLFALLAPHLHNEGSGNTGWIGEHKGMPMLFAQNGDFTLAFACSSNWMKRSAGYVGASDGWTDLQQHKKMEWEYECASDGNIALTGEIDISRQSDFVLALSFGRTLAEAANHAKASLLEGFDSAKKAYVDEWQEWQDSPRNVKAKNFRNSAAVLRVQEAKRFPGGIMASLSIPWGEKKGDSEKGGYHLVWPRDLVESAGGFLALETHGDVLRIVHYLMSTQNADGSWPQNMWLQGEHNWNALQIDEIALPIQETYTAYEQEAISKERMKRYWPLAKKAIAFLVQNGHYTPQDRWEEEQGYTPFTMAAAIAGLLAGAELAEINNEKEVANYCRETADHWNDMIEAKTYVTGTPLADKHEVEGYYLRINPFKDIPASEFMWRILDPKVKNQIKLNLPFTGKKRTSGRIKTFQWR